MCRRTPRPLTSAAGRASGTGTGSRRVSISDAESHQPVLDDDVPLAAEGSGGGGEEMGIRVTGRMGGGSGVGAGDKYKISAKCLNSDFAREPPPLDASQKNRGTQQLLGSALRLPTATREC